MSYSGNDRKNYYKKNTCINCGIYGHTFKYCDKPIISYGIIPYKIDIKTNKINYLLIERKDTIGYTDFIRGKYNNIETVKMFLEEMTFYEIIKLRTYTFEKLWNDIFMNKNCKIYVKEYYNAEEKYNKIDIIEMTDELVYYNNCIKYKEQEYGFPKGRSQLHEKQINSAIREFVEETGYSENDIKIDTNIIPFKEHYTGINNKEYTCIYYIGRIITDKIPFINKNNILQSGEVKLVKWFEYQSAYKLFRDYHIIKKHLLYKINTFLLKNF